jgi:hypothetical protein
MLDTRQDVARFLVTRGRQTDLMMAAALGDLDLVRGHLDANPASIRMRVTEEFFPMVNKRAGGTIYQWTRADRDQLGGRAIDLQLST